jgi:tRNA U55 pseudouridine synthase TruB
MGGLQRLISLNGVFAVNKPAGCTSAFVVDRIKKALVATCSSSKIESRDFVKKFKIGHGGTLDPMATGAIETAA